jgi:hypothetical protein
MNRKVILAATMFSLTALTLLSGCTHTVDVVYQASASRLPNAQALESVTVGVAKFEDKRAWVEAGDPKTESFISHAGVHKFGLNYLNKDWVPVKDLIQDALIKELTNAGIKAKALDVVLSKTSLKGTSELGTDVGDLQIGGQILAFDYVLQPGMWTVTARRTTILDLNLYRKGEAKPFHDQSISEMDTQEYGMATSHSVNAYNLVNEIFRKVAHQIVQQTADRLALK